MNAPFIPPRTRAELSLPAPRGQRHEQMLKLVLPLLGGGLTAEAVFVQLRDTYEIHVTDREIWDIIDWAAQKNPQPCGYSRKGATFGTGNLRRLAVPQRVTAKQASANAEKWLGNFRCDECDLWHASPWRPLEDWCSDALMILAALYDKHDFLNIVTDFTIEQQNDEVQKANPKGAGKTLLRDDWMRAIRDDGVPQSAAGAWIRLNPVKQHGTGTMVHLATPMLRAFGIACSKATIFRLAFRCQYGRDCRCQLWRSSTVAAEVLTHG